MNDIEIIRNEWFKNHKAIVTKLSDQVTTIDWKREDSGSYAVRYVFDGNKLYISGDIGEAAYWLTWKGTPESFKDVHFSYFNQKCQCSSRSSFEYCSEVFDKEVNEYMDDFKTELSEEKYDMYEVLFQEIKSEMEQYSHSEIQSFVMYRAATDCEYSDYLKIDAEEADYFSRFGRQPSISHLAYLEGLKMIAEQGVETK